MRRSRHEWFAVTVLLLGVALRAAPLTDNRFHPDEALYATFARLVASGRDPLLSTIVVDKPPLPFYLMAISMTVFGGTEFAARLPSLIASLVTIAVLYRLARSLYDETAAALATLTLTCSPLAILFAITLFTDSLLAVFLFLTLLLIVRRRWAAAGWAFGLAFACKQTAIFFLPLVVAIGAVSLFHHSLHGEHRAIKRTISVNSVLSVVKSFGLPILLCAATVFIWDYVRHAPISFWAQGYSDNNPGRLVRSNEIWPRWWAWLDLAQFLTGAPAMTAALSLGLPSLLLLNRRSLPALYDFGLAGFALAFFTGYWLLAFNVWDRYLLILAPVVALLTGRLLSVISNWLLEIITLRQLPITSNQLLLFILSLLTVVLLPSAGTAARSGFPIGGDHGAYDGIDQIADTLKTVPPGSVLYDHWLSWELGFYLFDGPTYTLWVPGPGALADDLRSFGRASPRYIVSPAWESFTEMQAGIEDAGFVVEIVLQTYRRDGSLSFTLFQILPQ